MIVMTIPMRVTPQEVYPRVKAGETLLVCAYPDEAKCRSLQLDGALTFQDFQTRLSSIPKNQEIVFYCAWTNEHSSAGAAGKLLTQGYPKAKALLGGVAAWEQAGYPIIQA